MSAEDENRFTVHRDEPGEMYAPEPEQPVHPVRFCGHHEDHPEHVWRALAVLGGGTYECPGIGRYGWWRFADDNAGILAFIIMMICLAAMAVLGG